MKKLLFALIGFALICSQAWAGPPSMPPPSMPGSALFETKYIDAGAMVPDTSTGLLQKKSTNNQFDYLEFSGASVQYATFRIQPPATWNLSTVKAKVSWAAGEAMTNNDTPRWVLACLAVSDGDSLDNALTAGAVNIDDDYATGDETGPIRKLSAASGAITVQGTPAAGDAIYCRIGGDAHTDAHDKKMWLLGLQIQFGLTGTESAW